MLPNIDNYEEDEFQDGLVEKIIPDKTYHLNFKTMTIAGLIDDREAKEQAVNKILMTESEVYPIYDAGYGRIFDDLIGKPLSYALSEAKDRIEESVLQDDRFVSVSFFDQKVEKRKLTLSFIISCTDGEEFKVEGVEVDV
ncbi:MAG: DUF2634 domain-containing protein [Eubacterium sp.]|nr:DUF2634 domain-containing protein [Eubacterium sp.]